jgi:hypothetical protein
MANINHSFGGTIMKNIARRCVQLGMSGLVTTVFAASLPVCADVTNNAGNGNTQKTPKGNFDERIEQRIQRIEDAIAKHPNMPADVKSALQKIVADLGVKKMDMDKLAGDVAAKNKDAVKADREKVRSDEIQILNDRLPLIDARINRIENRLSKHPDAPANVKTAAQTLITDLKNRKADLVKLISDMQAKNKDAAKADREKLKSDHEQIVKDRQALRQLAGGKQGNSKSSVPATAVN